MREHSPFSTLRLVALILFAFTSAAASAQTSLVISQIYGGGGNSGATYTNDFIELYNPTSAAISVNGWSVQYASATGSSWQVTQLGDQTVQPGHYLLVQEAKGNGGTESLPTPDASGSIAMSGTAGKVALVNGTSALTGSAAGTAPLGGNGCPTTGMIVDLVGFGTGTSGANCYTGSGPTPTLSNTTAAIRGSYTGNNAADFSTGAPNPHNSATGGTSALTASGQANPSSVTTGAQVTFTVTALPADAAGLAVTADLSAIGGSTDQPFDNTGGGVFTYTTTAAPAAPGTFNIPVSVTDAAFESTSTAISLTVTAPVTLLPIHTIQGSKSLTATSVSPYVGQIVKAEGIVTGVGSAGYFIEAPDSEQDADPSTPEGVYVYTGTGKVPTGAVVGNLVQVTGAISAYPAVTASHTPATELNSTAATVLATGQALPTPVVIDASKLTPTGGLYQLTPYEGMRVSFASLTSISGTDGFLTEASETVTSDGSFYVVLTGTPRPFREPGIDIRDSQVGLPSDVAFFDDNPERIIVDSDFLGGTAIDLSTGAVLPNVMGILDFTYSSDSYYDPSRLLIDPGYNRAQITPGMSVQPVPAPAANEFTVAAYNIERFFNPNPADNIEYNPVTGNTGSSSAVNVTQAAYDRRLAKVSLAIRHVLGSPDIVALEEAENQSVVADIAAKISTDAQAAGEPDPQYMAYGTGTSYAPYTNDIGGISVGFLVKATTVNALNVQQLGANDLFTDPRNANTQQTLNDRPPLVLHAGVKRANATDYPVTVIVNHLRSLSGENDPSSGVFVRTKKELQAEYLANLIQSAQSAGEHVIAVGDFNAFEFSDGYIDILGTITNQNVLPATQVLVPGVAGLVNPPATDLAWLLPPAERWSYQEFGNAQILDHIVATSNLAGAHLAYAHLDADQPLIAYNDATIPARASDHDAAVGYFTLPAPALTATLTGSGAFGSISVGSTSSAQSFVLSNTGEGQIAISNITASGDFAETNTCGSTLAMGENCTISVVFAPTAGGTRTGTLTVRSNAGSGAYTAALSGTGAYDSGITFHAANTQLVYPGATNITACVLNAPGNTATGSMKIYDGTTLLTTQPVQGGGCAYWYISPGLAAGTHQLSAYYTGNAKYPAGQSAPVEVVVKPVTVNLSAACWLANGDYQCTVSASSNAGSAPGVITYILDGGTAVSVSLNYGNAQFTLVKPVVGSHTVSIAYPQQGNFAAATAGTKTFTVTSH